MPNFQDLREFLVLAKKATYASGNKNIENKEIDGSTSLMFEDGDFQYHDNYFGGEPYGGREVVFYKGRPTYKYIGEIDNFSGGEVIEYNGDKIYEARYIGGLVDQNRE